MEKLERYMIEGCLDDELNTMFDPFIVKGEEVEPAEIIKKCRPDLYEKFILDYCDRENIIITKFGKGFMYTQM